MDLAENGQSGAKKKIKRMKVDQVQSNGQVSREEILQGYRELMEKDQEAFDKELDALEQSDPELFDYICEELGLFGEDDPNEE